MNYKKIQKEKKRKRKRKKLFASVDGINTKIKRVLVYFTIKAFGNYFNKPRNGFCSIFT